MSDLLEKPDPPGEFECCESGCSSCVWDFYFDKLDEWKRQQSLLKEQAEQEASSDE
jgi:hypothetical protein